MTEQRPNLRALTPSHHRLLHSLAVADVHLDLLAVGVQRDQRAEISIEPDCWRSFTGLGGEARILKPDLAAELSGRDDDGVYVDRWFIEVDLGTESLPTLLRKCGAYEAYYRSGVEQQPGDGANGSFPLVLWIFNRPERIYQLKTAVERAHSLTPAMFRYATSHGIGDLLGGGAS